MSLMSEPRRLLLDEPSIGFEPRFIDLAFDILRDLQRGEGKTIVMAARSRPIPYDPATGRRYGRHCRILDREDIAPLHPCAGWP